MSKKMKSRLLSLLLLVVVVLLVRFVVLPGSDSAADLSNSSSTEAPYSEPVATLSLISPAPSESSEEPEEEVLDEDGSYYDVDDVANYLHTYGHLPDNYLTKSEAEDAGWDSSKGNLWDVAYGMSIGGDRYGNYEGNLPKGETYYECDVNYDGGYRSGDRIVYSDSGSVWYTTDHYGSFEKIY